jgi:O-succinylbenzoic acid--CoA ligase
LQTLIGNNFFITGVKDVQWGQKLVLIIEGEPFNENEISSLNRSMEELLAKFEVPKEIYFIDHFIEAGNGKMDRLKTTEAIAGPDSQ